MFQGLIWLGRDISLACFLYWEVGEAVACGTGMFPLQHTVRKLIIMMFNIGFESFTLTLPSCGCYQGDTTWIYVMTLKTVISNLTSALHMQ